MKPSEQIDKLIAKLSDWRGKTLADIRRAILEAGPQIVEEWKWMGTPTWSHNGIICIANAYEDKIKITFYEGANIVDPSKLFNNGLEGKKWRSIDIFKDTLIKEGELRDLVRSAISYNQVKKSSK